jgi:cytochrome oxidase Cu insertion factor (SCO1/SenC/PrrC family)
MITAALLLATLLAQADGHEQHRTAEPVVRAPGYAALTFEPPAPGSYALPALGPAADGRVLDAEGRPTRLHELYEDRFVVLSFIYTSCPDVNGCPLAGFVLRQLQKRLAADPALAGDVRLISLSFDPLTDTPERMRQYGANLPR